MAYSHPQRKSVSECGYALTSDGYHPSHPSIAELLLVTAVSGNLGNQSHFICSVPYATLFHGLYHHEKSIIDDKVVGGGGFQVARVSS